MFVWGIFVLTFPLWCPGAASILRNEGVVNVFYSPGNRPRTLGKFLQAVIPFAARAMDRILQRHGIERINVWAMDRVRLPEHSRKGVWQRLNLTFDDNLGQMRTAGYLSRLVATDPQ